MTLRPTVAATLALLLIGPLGPAHASGADPLTLPGTPPKPAPEVRAGGEKAGGEKAGGEKAAAAKAAAEGAAPAGTAPMSEAQRYCQNIAAAAADARFAWQSKKLSDIEAKIKQRVAELESRQAEVADILNRYNEAIKRAKAGLIDIYAKMKPETAASQIAAMDDGPAAAILSQLSPGKASAILNEIPAERAVRLVSTMAALTPPPDKKS